MKNRSFDRSDAVNADLLDDLSQTVCDQVKAAKKAKKPIKVKMTPPDQTISLGELTDAYIMEGMSCINNAGRTKGPGKKRRGREQRNRAAFDELARLCSEDPAEAEAAEADEAETVAEAEIEAEAPPETADT